MNIFVCRGGGELESLNIRFLSQALKDATAADDLKIEIRDLCFYKIHILACVLKFTSTK